MAARSECYVEKLLLQLSMPRMEESAAGSSTTEDTALPIHISALHQGNKGHDLPGSLAHVSEATSTFHSVSIRRSERRVLEAAL